MEQPEGIAAADAHLGRPVPLPTVPLPLARWVDVTLADRGGVEVGWNLDDSRPGTPGRLALYVGPVPPQPHDLDGATETTTIARGFEHRSAPLDAAQPSLRPVQELTWRRGDLHLRLTAQGPWELDELVRVAESVAG